MCSATTRKPHPKSKFDKHEDDKLKRIVKKYGENNWTLIASKMKNRTSRQCRERWLNYLNPSINKTEWTEEEDDLLYEKINQVGRRWKIISTFFDNRTDINIKNRWLLLERRRKKLIKNKGMTKGTINTKKEENKEDSNESKLQEKKDSELINENIFSFEEFNLNLDIDQTTDTIGYNDWTIF